MRIAMLGWEFPPFISGGLGVHCFELTKRLCNLGVKVDFFMPDTDTPVNYSYPNLRIITACKSNLRPYTYMAKGKSPKFRHLTDAVYVYNKSLYETVMQEAKTHKYALLHGHDWLTVQAADRLKQSLKLPLFQTFHSTEYDRTSNPFDYIIGLEKQGLYAADRVITVSMRMKQRLIAMGCPEYKIRVIYNGVDWGKFEKKNSLGHLIGKIHEPYFRRKRKIVLFLGRLTEQKGPVQFLLAASKVLKKDKDVLFLMAGTGDLLPTLIALSISLGMSDSVMFLGRIPEDDAKRIYSIADLYIMPSVSEPFGITALEAMSSGTPVMISKTSGVAEVVKSAIRVDFWDIDKMAQSMLAVLKYRNLSNAMSNIAVSESKKLTWEKTAAETYRAYCEIANQHGVD